MTEAQYPVEGFLPYVLNQAAEVSSLSFEKIYKAKYGMLRTEWRVLFHLGLYGELTASEICCRAKLHKTKISRAVQRLTEQRMIIRKRDQDDRRVEHLKLTKKGQAAYADLCEIAESYEAKLVCNLTQEELTVLRSALAKLAVGNADDMVLVSP